MSTFHFGRRERRRADRVQSAGPVTPLHLSVTRSRYRRAFYRSCTTPGTYARSAVTLRRDIAVATLGRFIAVRSLPSDVTCVRYTPRIPWYILLAAGAVAEAEDPTGYAQYCRARATDAVRTPPTLAYGTVGLFIFAST